VELGIGGELLGEEARLTLLGLGVLFGSGQVEDQVGDDEGLGWFMKPGDVFLAEAREVTGVDLFGTAGSGTRSRVQTWNLWGLHRPQTRSCYRNRACRLGTTRCQWR